jgi:hypothetical protein
LERNTVQKILKAENRRIGKDKESKTEKRNQRELLGRCGYEIKGPSCLENGCRSPSNYIIIE